MPLSEPIEASASDGLEITKVHVFSTKDGKKTKLMMGSVDQDELIAIMAVNFSADIGRPFTRYLVIKDLETNAIVSYVKWVIPHTLEEAAEEDKSFRAGFKGPPRPVGMNDEMNKEFMEKINGMRKEILGDPPIPHYLCGNLATLPSHQKQGAASKLMKWPFERADTEGVALYLDTDREGPAISGYKKLGFVEVGHPVTIDLSKYGGTGIHTHCGMMREPHGVAKN